MTHCVVLLDDWEHSLSIIGLFASMIFRWAIEHILVLEPRNML